MMLTTTSQVFSPADYLAMQSDVDLISEWIDSRGLRLNLVKTKFIVISQKRKPPTTQVSIFGSSIKQVFSIRYLGVTMSSDLSWSAHIQATCCSAKRLLGFLYRFFREASGQCLSYLYKALVRPRLEYCGSIWDPYQAKYIDQLEGVQSFAARIATKRWSDSSAILRQDLGWPLLSARRAFQKLCLCRRILCGGSLVPASVFEPHPVSKIHHVNSCPLFKPFVRTHYHRNSYFVSVIPLWNAVPESIVLLSSDLAFKRHLKKFMVV